MGLERVCVEPCTGRMGSETVTHTQNPELAFILRSVPVWELVPEQAAALPGAVQVPARASPTQACLGGH